MLRRARSYLVHLAANWRVALRCLVLGFFHFVHGVLPVSLTDHHYYGYSDDKDGPDDIHDNKGRR